MISINVNCDECRNPLDDGDAVYCQRCFRERQSEIDELNKTIDELRDKLYELESK